MNNIVLKYAQMVKFSHTIFAFPFAMVGFFAGVQSSGFSWWVLLWVVVAMVSARNSAMGFNRLVDRKYDRANIRTANREIPSGKISVSSAQIFIGINIAIFILSAAMLGWWCFVLSPVALSVILGYSFTKRYTSLCHLILGLGLAIAPVAAYLAVTGGFSAMIFIVSVLVLTWVSGFDIIFALQDADFDTDAGLYSIPAKLGVKRGLLISSLLHLMTFIAVIVIGCLWLNILWYWIGAALFTGLLIFQHVIVSPKDLSRVNLAFGTTNGVASVMYGIFTIIALFVAR